MTSSSPPASALGPATSASPPSGWSGSTGSASPGRGALLPPAEADHPRGDASKAEAELGWKPKLGFGDLVTLMLEHDLAEAGVATADRRGVTADHSRS